MKNYILKLHRYRVWDKQALINAGYTHRPDTDDYIRNDHWGRFHAKIIKQQTVDIHYDLTIDGKHSVFDMPYRLHKEVGRIKGSNKKYRLSDEEWNIKYQRHLDKIQQWKQRSLAMK